MKIKFLERLHRRKSKTKSNDNINKSPEVQTNKILKKELIDIIATMIQNGAQIVEFEKPNGARVFDVEGKDRKFIRIEETKSGLTVTQDDNVLILCDANGNDLYVDFNAIVEPAKKEAERKQADEKMYTTKDSQRHTGTPNYNAERRAIQRNTIPPYVDRTVYVTRCPQQQNSQTSNNKTKISTEQIDEYGVTILRTYEIDGNTISCSIQPLCDETVKIEHYKIEVRGEVQNGIFICKVSGTCFPYYYSKFLQKTQHPYETEFYIGLNIEKIKNDPQYLDYVFCEFLKGRISALDKNINAKVKNQPIRNETFGLYLGSIVEENGTIKTVFDKEFCTFATNDKHYQTFEEKVVALIYEENGISFDSTQPSYDTEITKRYR